MGRANIYYQLYRRRGVYIFYTEEKGLNIKHTVGTVQGSALVTQISDPSKFNFIELIILPDIGCKLLVLRLNDLTLISD